ncbi:CBS domain-containing protein [bacterium]|nr:MAG: CBS domain-containing protein [bacterium]
MTLREVLHAHIPTLHPESTVRDAVDKMDIYQFPALVIVDEDMRPLAVITEGDLCRAASHRDSVVSLSDEPALVHASREPIVIAPDVEIGDAFHLMLARGITLLPILESERLMGVVLRTDLMQALMMDAVEGA